MSNLTLFADYDYVKFHNTPPGGGINVKTGEYAHRTREWFKLEILPLIVPFISNDKSKVRWLEIGAGYAPFSQMMLEYADKVIITDPAPKRIKFAERTNSVDNISFHVVDGKDVHTIIKRRDIDIITMINSFQHMPVNIKAGCLRSCYSILKKSGMIILVDTRILETDDVLATRQGTAAYAVSFGWFEKLFKDNNIPWKISKLKDVEWGGAIYIIGDYKK